MKKGITGNTSNDERVGGVRFWFLDRIMHNVDNFAANGRRLPDLLDLHDPAFVLKSLTENENESFQGLESQGPREAPGGRSLRRLDQSRALRGLESLTSAADPLEAVFERTGLVLKPVYGNAIIVDAKRVDTQAARFAIIPNLKIALSTVKRNVICRRNFLTFQARIHVTKSSGRFGRLPFSCTGCVASRSMAIQSAVPPGLKIIVSFARRRGDQDVAK